MLSIWLGLITWAEIHRICGGGLQSLNAASAEVKVLSADSSLSITDWSWNPVLTQQARLVTHGIWSISTRMGWDVEKIAWIIYLFHYVFYLQSDWNRFHLGHSTKDGISTKDWFQDGHWYFFRFFILLKIPYLLALILEKISCLVHIHM